mmetsp:Transcript_37510/g.87353  ORF Transcript_37510/g.87353 Transcript_37510/m.87353 type:complete len:237 (-) Transcript_37510:1037-1747(-)
MCWCCSRWTATWQPGRRPRRQRQRPQPRRPKPRQPCGRPRRPSAPRRPPKRPPPRPREARHDHAACRREAAAAGQPLVHRVHAGRRADARHDPAGPGGRDARCAGRGAGVLGRAPAAPRRRAVGLRLRLGRRRARWRLAGPACAGLQRPELRRDHAASPPGLVQPRCAGRADCAAVFRRPRAGAGRADDGGRHVAGLERAAGAGVRGCPVAPGQPAAARPAAPCAGPRCAPAVVIA